MVTIMDKFNVKIINAGRTLRKNLNPQQNPDESTMHGQIP